MLCNRCVSRVDSVVRLIWVRIVFFLLLRMSQRWRGLMQSATLLVNMAVMHPFRPLSFMLNVYGYHPVGRQFGDRQALRYS